MSKLNIYYQINSSTNYTSFFYGVFSFIEYTNLRYLHWKMYTFFTYQSNLSTMLINRTDIVHNEFVFLSSYKNICRKYTEHIQNIYKTYTKRMQTKNKTYTKHIQNIYTTETKHI